MLCLFSALSHGVGALQIYIVVSSNIVLPAAVVLAAVAAEVEAAEVEAAAAGIVVGTVATAAAQ